MNIEIEIKKTFNLNTNMRYYYFWQNFTHEGWKWTKRKFRHYIFSPKRSCQVVLVQLYGSRKITHSKDINKSQETEKINRKPTLTQENLPNWFLFGWRSYYSWRLRPGDWENISNEKKSLMKMRNSFIPTGPNTHDDFLWKCLPGYWNIDRAKHNLTCNINCDNWKTLGGLTKIREILYFLYFNKQERNCIWYYLYKVGIEKEGLPFLNKI